MENLETPFVVRCTNPTIRTTKDTLYVALEEGAKGYLIRCDTGSWIWLGRNRFEVVSGDTKNSSEATNRNPRQELVDALKVVLAHNAQSEYKERVYIDTDGDLIYNEHYYPERYYEEVFKMLGADPIEKARREKAEQIEEAEARLERLNKEYSELS